MSRGQISIQDVVKVYDPEGAAVMAVDHCSLDIEPGEICMIVGPSGCGKTTLLNAIAGFHEITSGRIVMDGEAKALRENEDVKEFYLGMGGGDRKSFRDVKSYKRRKRWLS